MAAVVSVEGVVKRYTRGSESVSVLRGVDITIEAGEFVAVMGPSGSGKSTLLNLIGGLDKPDAGVITAVGARIDTMPAALLSRWRARNVGFVFQFYHLLSALTARQNVELPLLTTGLRAAQKRRNALAALEIVGIADCASRRPAQLSGGEQQRVAIARALVADPALLVCDEPTGDLDRDTADGILNLLQLLNDQLGTSIVMVTHDLRAARYAARTLHVDKGHIVEPEMRVCA